MKRAPRPARFSAGMTFLLLLLAAGCAAPVLDVKTAADPMVDFSALRSYGWEEGRVEDDRTTTLDESRADAVIREAVDEELAAKGFALRKEGSPDFRIRYRLAVKTLEDRVELAAQEGASRPYASWKYRQGEGRTEVVNRWRQGTLVLQVLNGADGRILWEGSARAEAGREPDPGRAWKKIRTAVRRILESFPPEAD